MAHQAKARDHFGGELIALNRIMGILANEKRRPPPWARKGMQLTQALINHLVSAPIATESLQEDGVVATAVGKLPKSSLRK